MASEQRVRVVEYKQDEGLVLSDGWWHGFVVGCCVGGIGVVVVLVVLAFTGVL